MCYSIYLSTDSDQDLSAEDSDLVRYQKETVPEPYHSLLKNPHHWYVGSVSGCSCAFRHLYSTELGFSEPADWYVEDEEAISATLMLIKIIRQLINQGYKVDCIDTWYGARREDITELIVNLDHIADEQFRFFENHHFVFDSAV